MRQTYSKKKLRPSEIKQSGENWEESCLEPISKHWKKIAHKIFKIHTNNVLIRGPNSLKILNFTYAKIEEKFLKSVFTILCNVI